MPPDEEELNLVVVRELEPPPTIAPDAEEMVREPPDIPADSEGEPVTTREDEDEERDSKVPEEPPPEEPSTVTAEMLEEPPDEAPELPEAPPDVIPETDREELDEATDEVLPGPPPTTRTEPPLEAPTEDAGGKRNKLLISNSTWTANRRTAVNQDTYNFP